jgi:hypothetical protein
MQGSGVPATPRPSIDKSAASPPKARAAALTVIFAAALFAFFRGVLFKRLEEGDEGTKATMALNMCGSFEGVLHPSYLAGRAADWLTGSLPAMAVTPFHAGLVALAACPTHGSVAAMGLVSFAALAATLFCTFQLFAIWDRTVEGLSLSSVKREGTSPAALKLAAVASVVSVLGICLAYAKHIKPEDIVGVIDLRAPAQPFAEIASLVGESVAHRPQQEPDFISPNYRVLGLYLFHNGRYWQSYYQTLATDWQEAYSTGRICAFVFGPDDSASKALEPPVAAIATDLTGRLPAWARDYHVYVNPARANP